MARPDSSRPHEPTIMEVARLAGVAPSSASRALNGQPDVSAELRARVLRAADQLGYQPDFLAQSLRRGATRTIGFIVRDISLPLFAGIVKGAEQVLEQEGYSVLLTNSLQNPHLEAKHIGVLCGRRVDGLILSLQSETNAESLLALRRARVPMVLLDRDMTGVTADAVLFDHATGVEQATTHLLELGHRRIALLIGSTETRASRERLRGYLNAYERAEIPVRVDDVHHMDTFTPDFQSTTSALLGRRPVTAIVAGDSQLGVGLLRALRERGVHHGRDMSVIVCDDLDVFHLTDPPVSVVTRDADASGMLAARLLIRRLREPSADPDHQLLPTELILRGSTSAPPVASRRRHRAGVGR